MKQTRNSKEIGKKIEGDENSGKSLKKKRRKKKGYRNAIDRVRNRIIRTWGGQLPTRQEVTRLYEQRDTLVKNISILHAPDKHELIKAKKRKGPTCLIHGVISIEEIPNPAPHASFGFASNVFKVNFKDGYHNPGMLFLPLLTESLKTVYPKSVQIFRWTDNIGYSLIPMSGFDPENEICWARIAQPGIYVAIGMTRLPLLKGFIQNFRNLRQLDTQFEQREFVQSFINTFSSLKYKSEGSQRNQTDSSEKTKVEIDRTQSKKSSHQPGNADTGDRIIKFSQHMDVPGLLPETRLHGSESWLEKQFPEHHRRREDWATYRHRSNWTNIAPINITCVIVCLAVHPTDPNILYAGSEFGGVFKTYDRGATWISMMEREPNLSIYSIAVSKSNPEVVYAGGRDFFLTKGTVFYKSVNGGYNWEAISLRYNSHVKAIAVDPLNSDIVYVATDNYLCKSMDGGRSWLEPYEITIDGVKEYTHELFPGNIYDVKIDPQNSSTVYISVKNRGVFKTIDGLNWTRIGWWYGFDLLNDESPPKTIVGKLDGTYRTVLAIGNDRRPGKHGSNLIIAKTQGTIIYSTIAGDDPILEYHPRTGPPSSPQPTLGESWKVLSSDMGYDGQNDWCSCVAVCPSNEEFIVAGGSGIQFVKDWNSKPTGLPNSLHEDQQHIVFSNSGNGDFYFCNDGYIGFASNYGSNVEKISDGLIASQIDHFAISQSAELIMAATTYHTGTIRSGRTNPEIWEWIDGPELGMIAIDPNDPNIMLGSPGGGPVDLQPLKRSTDGGVKWNTVSQYAAVWCIEFHPLLPEKMIVAASEVDGQVIFSVDRGLNWHVVLNTLNQPLNFGEGLFVFSWAESTTYRGFLGTGIGRLWGFFVPGVWKSWSEINTPLPASPPGSTDGISAIYAHPSDGSVYIGYNTTKHQTLFHGIPSGQGTYVWTPICGLYPNISLPQAPVVSIIVDPWNLQRIFVATIVGVFVSEDHGLYWRYLNFGIPNVDITSMKLHKPSRKLVLSTWGRGIFISDFEIGEHFDA